MDLKLIKWLPRVRFIGLGLAMLVGLVAATEFYAPRLQPHHASPVFSTCLDRIIVIMLESYRSDEVDPEAIALNPFLTELAAKNGVAVNYYGVWKPSLPNYLAMIGGDVFDVHNNLGSCFNPDHATKCNAVDDVPTSWTNSRSRAFPGKDYLNSMPSVGFLGEKFPLENPRYAQKHNPFVYFKNIALDPARLSRLSHSFRVSFTLSWLTRHRLQGFFTSFPIFVTTSMAPLAASQR